MTDLMLSGEGLTAHICTCGAELIHFEHAEHGSLLWNGDARWWDRRSPILFPVVGRCAGDRIRVGGETYPMPLHGFAHSLEFEVVEQERDRCRLRLRDSDATRLHYPFAFSLEISYRLDDSALRVEAIVHNPTGSVLPASFGFHPGFRWPLAAGVAKESHVLVFEADEELDVSRARAGLIGPDIETMALEGRALALSEDLFDEGAMVIKRLASRRVRLSAPDAPLAVEVGFRNLPSLGIWMRPSADFLCIEPWAGHGDPAGFAGDLSDKPGIVSIAPGASASFGMEVAVLGKP